MPRALGGRTPLGSSVATRPSKLTRRHTSPPGLSFCETFTYDGLAGITVTTVSFAASTPDSAPLSITGDIDIRARITLDNWTPFGERQFVTKMLDTAQGYMFRMIGGFSGILDFDWTDSGGGAHGATATTATGFANGTTHWVRVTMDVNNGAGGRDITFYGSDDGVVWTQIGATVTQAGTTSIKNTTDSVYLGGVDSNSGVLHNVEIRDGIGGTVVADPDFTIQPVGTLSFSDGTNTWSVLSDALFTTAPGRLGTVTTDLTWSESGAGAFVADVQGDRCVPHASIGSARAEHDTTSADMFVQCDWVDGDDFGNEIFLIGRCGDTSDLIDDQGIYLFVAEDGGGEADITIQGWTPSGVIASGHVAASVLATWRLELIGTECRGYRNGILVISGTSTLSPQPAGTQAGFEIEFDTVAIDNFCFGDLTSFSA